MRTCAMSILRNSEYPAFGKTPTPASTHHREYPLIYLSSRGTLMQGMVSDKGQQQNWLYNTSCKIIKPSSSSSSSSFYSTNSYMNLQECKKTKIERKSLWIYTFQLIIKQQKSTTNYNYWVTCKLQTNW